MSAYIPGGDDCDHDLAALFSGAGEHSDGGGAAAWSIDAMYGETPAESDESATTWMAEDSHVTAMPGDASAELFDTSTDVNDIHEPGPDGLSVKPADPGSVNPFTVANPAGTAWVSAGIGGTTLRVELSPTVVHMTEAQLAEEICVLADLAGLKGQAGQRALMPDVDVANADGEGLATPEQAAAAQAHVFATRYGADS